MALIRVSGHREIARWRADDGRTYVLTWTNLVTRAGARLLFRPRKGAAFVVAGRMDPAVRKADALRYATAYVRRFGDGDFTRVERSHEGGWRPVGRATA